MANTRRPVLQVEFDGDEKPLRPFEVRRRLLKLIRDFERDFGRKPTMFGNPLTADELAECNNEQLMEIASMMLALPGDERLQ